MLDNELLALNDVLPICADMPDIFRAYALIVPVVVFPTVNVLAVILVDVLLADVPKVKPVWVSTVFTVALPIFSCVVEAFTLAPMFNDVALTVPPNVPFELALINPVTVVLPVFSNAVLTVPPKVPYELTLINPVTVVLPTAAVLLTVNAPFTVTAPTTANVVDTFADPITSSPCSTLNFVLLAVAITYLSFN
jgi:hypothetical protein